MYLHSYKAFWEKCLTWEMFRGYNLPCQVDCLRPCKGFHSRGRDKLADVAQLVEQAFRKCQVRGSSPLIGSPFIQELIFLPKYQTHALLSNVVSRGNSHKEPHIC